MEVILSSNAFDDLEHWKRTGNIRMIERIRLLIEAIEIDAFHGIGKPEPLKYKYSGAWSRRINREHRLIYKIEAGSIIILTLKDHYKG